MINVKELRNLDNFEKLSICSLGYLRDFLDYMIRYCELNHKDPYKVPVLVSDQSVQDDYILSGSSLSFGRGFVFKLDFYGNDKDRIDYFEGEDRKPEGGGEFWKSRGPSDWDCSGFVASKEAGERLLAMVHEVLGLEKTKSWLDWRKIEPNWIQFKFSAKEFDVKKLDELSRKEDVVTMEILKQCKL